MNFKSLLIWAVVLYVAWHLWKHFLHRRSPEKHVDGTQIVAGQYRL